MGQENKIRFFFIFAAVIFMCVCSGCAKEEKEELLQGIDHMSYPMENISVFAVSESGSVISAAYNIEREQQEISVYRLDGVLTEKWKLDEISKIKAIAVQRNEVYFAGTDQKEELALYRIIISDKKENGGLNEKEGLFYDEAKEIAVEKLAVLDGVSDIRRMEIKECLLYMMVLNPVLENKDYAYADENDNFVYSGEQFVSFDINSGKIKEIAIDFPIVFSMMLDGNFLLSAHDDEGFYFTVYSPENGKFSKKKYRNDLGQLICMQAVGTQGGFLYRTQNVTTRSVLYTEVDGEGKKELVPDGEFIGNSQDIFYRGGLTFYMGKNCVEMVCNQVYLRNEKVIRVARCGSQSFVSSPFGCGYEITIEDMDEESFSLALLSQDMDYDLYMLQSRQGISEYIKNQGSFYPLNDVEYVNEFFAGCLPYVKEAAVDEDGMIWMLPFYVQTSTFVYNEDMGKTGIQFRNDMSLEEFLDHVQILYDKKQQENISVNGNYLIRYLMRRYFQIYKYLDTEQFREMAVLLKEKMSFSDGYASGAFGSEAMVKTSESLARNDGHFLGSLEEMIVPSIYNTSVRAMAIPSVNSTEKTAVDCYFMTVNPSSSHRKSTLSYISSLVSYMMEKKDTMLFESKECYFDTKVAADFYDIYKNGSISFAIPEELYLEDILSYLSGEKELEEVISESDRKIDIYRRQ